jgi:cytochrome P450 family 114
MPTQQSIDREAQDVVEKLLAPGLENPYPLYVWLRENAPVVYSERYDAYLLSRFADCERAFRSPHLFRSEEHDTLMELLPQSVEAQEYRALFSSLVGGNPLPYTPLRRLIAQLLTPDVVRMIRDGMRRICDVVLDAVAAADDGRPVDLHTAVSVPVAERALSALVGVPRNEFVEASALLRRMLQLMQAAPGRSAQAEAESAFGDLAEYVDHLLEHSRQSPGGNLATMMSRGSGPNGSRLTPDQIRTTLITLWAGGVEKAVVTIDMAAVAVLRQPGLVEWLRDEEIAATFVDELYRWDSPGQISTSPRHAVTDIDFGGLVVPAGAGVRMLLGAANRDPEAYPNPDRLMPSRIGPDPLLSGAGFQPCVGTGLARLQICVLLPHLFERFPDLRLAGEPVWRRSMPLRELSSIPVRLGASQALRSGVPVSVGTH